MNGDPFQLPIDGTLDLHAFSPSEAKSLIREYIDVCRAHGILQLRIIHGKGTGTLRRIVHASLARHPAVMAYRTGDESGGSWGATLVDLQPLPENI
ncbi:MAG: Smr/MutS family protein [Candidatus Zixiibacteriota bacterium]